MEIQSNSGVLQRLLPTEIQDPSETTNRILNIRKKIAMKGAGGR